MTILPNVCLFAAMVLAAAVLIIPSVAGKPEVFINPEKAWREFFDSRAALKVLFAAAAVMLVIAWWALSYLPAAAWEIFCIAIVQYDYPGVPVDAMTRDFVKEDNLMDAFAAAVQSDDKFRGVVWISAIVLTSVIFCVHIIGYAVCRTVIKEFSVMHGVTQQTLHKFGTFKIKRWEGNADKWSQHLLFPVWLHILYFYAFSWRASFGILVIATFVFRAEILLYT